MQLTDAQVGDFNRAYAEAFETELPPVAAQTMLGNLVELYTRLIEFAGAHPTHSDRSKTEPAIETVRQAEAAP